MGRACCTHGGDYVYTGFCWGKNEEEKTFRRARHGGRIILRWIFKEVGWEERGLDSSDSGWG